MHCFPSTFAGYFFYLVVGCRSFLLLLDFCLTTLRRRSISAATSYYYFLHAPPVRSAVLLLRARLDAERRAWRERRAAPALPRQPHLKRRPTAPSGSASSAIASSSWRLRLARAPESAAPDSFLPRRPRGTSLLPALLLLLALTACAGGGGAATTRWRRGAADYLGSRAATTATVAAAATASAAQRWCELVSICSSRGEEYRAVWQQRRRRAPSPCGRRRTPARQRRRRRQRRWRRQSLLERKDGTTDRADGMVGLAADTVHTAGTAHTAGRSKGAAQEAARARQHRLPGWSSQEGDRVDRQRNSAASLSRTVLPGGGGLGVLGRGRGELLGSLRLLQEEKEGVGDGTQEDVRAKGRKE